MGTLYDELQHEYTTLINKIDSLDSLDVQLTNGLLGALAHSAYHLGSIRQMIKSIKVPYQT